MIPTSVLKSSVEEAMRQFGDLLTAAVTDATAIFRTIYGISDGKVYGRYFAGQNPLVPYVPAATSIDAMLAQGVKQRQVALDAIAAAIVAAELTPEEFADAVFAAVDDLRQACAAPFEAIRLLVGLSTFDAVTHGGADPVGLMIDDLAENASVLMRRICGISLATATADYIPTSLQNATMIRDIVADVLDRLETEAADRFEDLSAKAMDNIRIAVIADLNERGGKTTPVVTHTYNQQQPALVLAYRLYQDAARAEELLARNDPPHPSWMPNTIEAAAA